MDPTLPHLLDELIANAIRADIVEDRAGWSLRAAPSSPFRRTNAARALSAEPGLDTLEQFYRSHGLPPRVRVISADAPALDPQLADRGYAVEAPVDVLVAERADIAAVIRNVPVEVAPVLAESWIDTYAPGGDVRVRAYAELLRASRSASVATAAFDGLGFGFVEREWVGIFGMATRPEARRRGVASSMLRALMALAPRAYLQVEVDNHAAHALYERAGFTRAYGYHYRTLALG